jgi:hypothetical protein
MSFLDQARSGSFMRGRGWKSGASCSFPPSAQGQIQESRKLACYEASIHHWDGILCLALDSRLQLGFAG